MTPEEVGDVVSVLAVAFARTTTAETFEVYEVALIDLDVPNPRGFVLGFIRTAKWWPSPAALREAILDAYGLLAPDEDQAWRAVLEAATHGGSEALPWPVQEAYRAVGGSWGVRTGTETTIRAQFRDAYRLAKAREDFEVMARDWKGLPLNPGGQLQLRHGRDQYSRPDGGRRGAEERAPGEAGPRPGGLPEGPE